ncbi:MAG: DUF4418 family protein [Treponema sp.]
MKKKYIFGVIFILFGVLLALMPYKIAPVCHAEKMMKCFWTARALLGTGILLAVLNVFFCIMRSGQSGIVISNILIALYAVAVQTVLIGTCKSPMMSCNTHTKPSVFLLVGLFIAVNAIYVLLSAKKR